MCTVSMVGDFYSEKWRPQFPDSFPAAPQTLTFWPGVTREEFDQLKREVQDMKLLLERARDYDRANGEPECSQEEKLALLRRVAELVGVEFPDLNGG